MSTDRLSLGQARNFAARCHPEAFTSLMRVARRDCRWLILSNRALTCSEGLK
jgi:hypothetical protein